MRDPDFRRWAREFWDEELPPGRFFRTSDVARLAFLDVSQRTVQRWVQEGKLVALGSSEDGQFEARVPRAALIDFLIRRMPDDAYPEQFDLFGSG